MFGNEAIYGVEINPDVPINTWELTLIPNKVINLNLNTYGLEYKLDSGNWVSVASGANPGIQTGNSTTMIVRMLRPGSILFNLSTGIQHAKILYGPYIVRLKEVFLAKEGLESVTIAAGQDVKHVDNASFLVASSDITDSFYMDIDFSHMTSLRGVFERCSNITQTFPVSIIDFSSAKFVDRLYSNCDSLVTI